jgi:acyl dehydratase
MQEPLFFDDIEIGQTWISPTRTVTETDVVNFANITGDCDPLHVDHEYAAQTQFGKPIAHGLLGVAWVAGLAIHNPMVKTAAFTSIRNWEFLAPVYFGDTVHVQTSVLELKPSGRRTGRVSWQKKLINQDGKVVQQGVFETLVATRASVPSPHYDSVSSKTRRDA